MSHWLQGLKGKEHRVTPLLPQGVRFESLLLLLLKNPIKIQCLAKLGIFIAKT